jgi:hypothetical protein
MKSCYHRVSQSTSIRQGITDGTASRHRHSASLGTSVAHHGMAYAIRANLTICVCALKGYISVDTNLVVQMAISLCWGVGEQAEEGLACLRDIATAGVQWSPVSSACGAISPCAGLVKWCIGQIEVVLTRSGLALPFVIVALVDDGGTDIGAWGRVDGVNHGFGTCDISIVLETREILTWVVGSANGDGSTHPVLDDEVNLVSTRRAKSSLCLVRKMQESSFAVQASQTGTVCRLERWPLRLD